MSQTTVRRSAVRARAFSPRSPGHRSATPYGSRARARRARSRSVAASLLAVVLLGTFIGVLTWKAGEQTAETTQLEQFHRPDVTADPPTHPGVPFADPGLAELLQRQAPTLGAAGLYVRNVTTGAEASVHADRVFPAASLYKLPIMTEVIRQARLRRLSLDQQLVVGREHWVPGSGVLQGRIGDALSMRELLRLLIVESDNIAAMMLLEVVGLENVNQTAQAMGLRSTRLLDYRGANAYNGLGPYTTSAADMGLLMSLIATGQLVDPTGSEEALRLLEKKQASEWLGEGLPWWVKLAHKWGEVPGARHDAGIVFTPRNQYVIVVMTDGLDNNGSAGYIREVSRAVFNYFERPR